MEERRIQMYNEMLGKDFAFQMNSNDAYRRHSMQMARRIKNITGTKQNVRAKADELLNLINSTLSQSVNIGLFVEKVGLLCAFVIRTLYFGRHSTDREIALMILMVYLSYITVEVFELSGILTVFFCGVVMSHYAWHNVTHNSQVTTKHTFATMSYIAEVFIFLYVGMDSLDVEKWKFEDDSPGKSIWASSILPSADYDWKSGFHITSFIFIQLNPKG